jgi:nitrogenase molybdenum-iron protein alpha/beta subunit
MDAVWRDDDKLIRKVAAAAGELRPRFITVLGSPVPMVVGTDFEGIASELEAVTGIPSFGIPTTGLHYYDWGAGRAFLQLARRFVRPPSRKVEGGVNLLGATPLDFGVNGDIPGMKKVLEAAGFQVLSDYAMDSTLDDLMESGSAQVNLVLSSSGMPLAEWMHREFGIPWVAGIPAGEKAVRSLTSLL